MPQLQVINDLAENLCRNIRGQDHVVRKLCSIVERAEFGLQPADKPKGSLLFLGPTGVGKTEMTLELARNLFQSPDKVFRFDMSEFLHQDGVKLFLGDETGSSGRLGRILEANQEGILLFDEFEKANRLIWDLFLQMTDSGRITLADHRTYQLHGFYLIFTSNIGSHNLLRNTRLPFATLERAVLAELSQVLRPELIARFDETLVFRPLSYEVQREIAVLTLRAELEKLGLKGIQLDPDSSAVELIVRQGIHRTLGARNMKKVTRRLVGDAVAMLLKKGAQPPFSGSLTVQIGDQNLCIDLT